VVPALLCVALLQDYGDSWVVLPPQRLAGWCWCKAVGFLPQRRSGEYWGTLGYYGAPRCP